MLLNEFLQQLNAQPESIEFQQVIDLISAHYDYTPTRFTNGVGADQAVNAAGTNEGSCRIFAFARLNGLDAAQTLACFGKFYRVDVLQNPEATDHANIRTFMRHGWNGIHFDGAPLSPKQ
jgi:HopJ type III effector protein